MAKYSCPVCSKPSTKEGGCFKHAPRKPLKTSKLKKKPKTKEEIDENKKEIEKQWAFFNSLWGKLPDIKRCWACGTRIYGQNLSIYWDHAVEKHSHPELKYEEENMFFCCGDCHTKKGAGFPLEKHKRFIENVKKQFNIE